MRPTKPTQHSDKGDAKPATERARRPYQPPAWEVEEVFEKMALACGKANDSDACSGPNNMS